MQSTTTVTLELTDQQVAKCSEYAKSFYGDPRSMSKNYIRVMDEALDLRDWKALLQEKIKFLDLDIEDRQGLLDWVRGACAGVSPPPGPESQHSIEEEYTTLYRATETLWLVLDVLSQFITKIDSKKKGKSQASEYLREIDSQLSKLPAILTPYAAVRRRGT